jgi:LacI family transcriptional regulator
MSNIVGLLRSYGHKRIGLVAHSPALSTGRDEVAGFFAALKDNGLTTEKRLYEPAEQEDIELGQQAFLRLHDRVPGLTAVIAAHDKLALGCIDGIRALGLSCPKHLSVIGFGDVPLIDRVSPSLTTMRIDLGRVGRLAADLMIRAIEEPALPAQHHVVDAVIVRRASVGKAPAR